MKKTIVAFAALVAPLAYLGFTSNDVQREIDVQSRVAPVTYKGAQPPPIAPGKGECDNPVVLKAVTEINAELPIKLAAQRKELPCPPACNN